MNPWNSSHIRRKITVATMVLWIPWATHATTRYVWQDSPNPTAPYTGWATAAHVIQDAVDAAVHGDTVLVAGGVYATGGRAATGLMTNRVTINKAIKVESLMGREVTIIVGAPAPGGGNGDGAIRCVYVGTNAVLSGFTMTNGHTRTTGDIYPGRTQQSGGGAWCELAGVITNCVLARNSANVYGGGVYRGTLFNCILSDNLSYTGWGGGSYGSKLYNCNLSGNSASQGGGAADCFLYNCTLAGNRALGSIGDGGGASQGYLYNCTLTGNSATRSGGGCNGGTLYNCTLTGNSAGREGGGTFYGTLFNCIVYYNEALIGSNYSFPFKIEFTCTTPLLPGYGNIDSDPLLATATHLRSNSPCLRAGYAAYSTGVDIDGEPWRNPPCIGADQIVPGQSFGSLTMTIEANYRRVVPGFTVQLVAQNQGPITSTVWDLGDGSVVTNQPYLNHSWPTPGIYPVTLRGYNDTYPEGVSVTTSIEVVEQVAYVNQANSTPQFPYDGWQKAATNIQAAIGAGSAAGRLVVVTNGVYRQGGVAMVATLTNRIALTNAVRVVSVNGPDVTVIEGAASTAGDDLGNGEGAVRCAYVETDSVLSGFTLAHGHTLITNNPNAYRKELQRGGGAWCEPSGIVTNCIVKKNASSSDGAGIYQGIVWNCILVDNESDEDGGGADNGRLYNCVIIGNSGQNGGGVDDSMLYGCVLRENQSKQKGGGAMRSELTHCTVVENMARVGGGACESVVFNSIVYHNRAPVGPNYNDVTNHYSCTQPLPLDGLGNIDADPLLASAFHLSATSPCIGAGSVEYIRGLDIDGQSWANPPSMGADELVPGEVSGPLSVTLGTRFTTIAVGYVATFEAGIDGQATSNQWDFGDGTVVNNQLEVRHAWTSAGVYAVQLRAFNDSNPAGISETITVHVVERPVFYVNGGNRNPVFPYMTWETAATNIQAAIGASAVAGRLIWVTNGVYGTGSMVVWGQMPNRIALLDGVAVQSVNGPEQTTILGGGIFPMRCAYVGDDAVLSGFTLLNGQTLPFGHNSREQGGGGAWAERTGVLTNCILLNNRAARDGGGVNGGLLQRCVLSGNEAGDDSGGADDAVLYNCILISNTAELSGGGAGESVLYDCTLTGNSAFHGGGAYWCTLSRCTLTNNTALMAGGGVGESTLYNCIVARNNASGVDPFWGAGGGTDGGMLYNCTITENTARAIAGGSYNGTLYNCILYYNWSNDNIDNYQASLLNYSCTTPRPTNGIRNITALPRFMNAAAGDYRLQPSSLCIDAGIDLSKWIKADREGLPRPLDGNGDGIAAFDMGAYEVLLHSADSNGDGIPDGWTDDHGLNPTDPSVAASNPDNDPFTTYQEWQADTNPTNAQSYFRIESISNGPPAIIQFQTSSNRVYSLLSSTNLSEPTWSGVLGQTIVPGNGAMDSLTDTNSTPEKYYRIGVQLP